MPLLRRVTVLLLFAALSLGCRAEPALQVWTRSDSSLPLLRGVAERFSARTGIRVEVSAPPSMLDRFQALAQIGQGPDLLVWAHDRMGEWADMGLLQPVSPSPELRQSVMRQGWQAFERRGRLWGWPLMLESPALILNLDLVSEAPHTLDDVARIELDMQRRGLHALKWEYMNAYYSWPMLDPGLGALFPAGQLAPAGASDPQVIRRLSRLQGWMAAGNMPFTADYIDMEREFNRSQLAMMIAGPWAWDNLRRSGIRFGLAPVPGIEGSPAPSFVGVVGIMLSRASTRQDVARKFVEEALLDPNTQVQLYLAAGLAGVPSHKGAVRALWGDRLLRQQLRLIHRGVLMPSEPGMRRVWSALGSALFNMGYGRQSPQEALDQAAARLAAP